MTHEKDEREEKLNHIRLTIWSPKTQTEKNHSKRMRKLWIERDEKAPTTICMKRNFFTS